MSPYNLLGDMSSVALATRKMSHSRKRDTQFVAGRFAIRLTFGGERTYEKGRRTLVSQNCESARTLIRNFAIQCDEIRVALQAQCRATSMLSQSAIGNPVPQMAKLPIELPLVSTVSETGSSVGIENGTLGG